MVAQVRKLNDSSGRRPQLCDWPLRTWLRRIHADRDKAGDGPEAVSAHPQPIPRWMEKEAAGGHLAQPQPPGTCYQAVRNDAAD